jgi:hypothetical protein
VSPSEEALELAAERERLEEAIRDAHKAAASLKEAVRAAREEMRVSAREVARRYLSKALVQASESLRKP